MSKVVNPKPGDVLLMPRGFGHRATCLVLSVDDTNPNDPFILALTSFGKVGQFYYCTSTRCRGAGCNDQYNFRLAPTPNLE